MLLSEESFGGLWLYLKNTTLELHEGDSEFDFAFNFDEMTPSEIIGIAQALLCYVEGDSSIE